MRKLIYVLVAIVALGTASCSKSMSQYDKEIDQAEKMMLSNPDSALSMLDAIDASELKIDSLRAKYHFIKVIRTSEAQPFNDWRFAYSICS